MAKLVFGLKRTELAAITRGQSPSGLVQVKWHATALILGALSEGAYQTVEGSPLYTSTLKPAGFNYVKSISVALGFLDWAVFGKPVVDAQCTVLASSTDIVVAVRGSESLTDWFMTNLDTADFTSPVWFPTNPFLYPKASAQVWPFNSATKVHPGFYEAMLALLPEVQASINAACRQNAQASSVWLTGHSMGGAVAMLMAAYLQDSNFIAPAGSNTKATHKCATQLAIGGVFGFENPKVGNADFARHYANIGLASRTLVYVHGGDPVPSTPPWPYNHVGFRVHTSRSIANPDVTVVKGPESFQNAASVLSGWGLADHKAQYWLTVLRNLATSTCQAAAAKRLITFACPDFGKFTASVVAPAVEVAEIKGSVYYLDSAGRKQVPTGKVSITCYDYDTPAPTALLMEDKEPMCTTEFVNGKFRCRYHRKMQLAWVFGSWDVVSPAPGKDIPFDTSEAQSWPDIECDIKPQAFLTGTYTGRLSTNQYNVVYNAGDIKLIPDRSKSCVPNGCGPSSELWIMKIAVEEKRLFDTWFTDSCANHDCCYATCGTTQKMCDDEFYMNMKWQCYQLPSAGERLRCMASAPIYYRLVQEYGEGPHKTAQIKSFCLGPSASTAAISGKVMLADANGQPSALVGALITCYDRDPWPVNELMCMAKSDASGGFTCYYYKKDSSTPWDDSLLFPLPDIGCSIQHIKVNTATSILAFDEDWKQAPVLDVGTIVVTASGEISKA
jgi:pimeloyl-ACP methyl ester carboxylesterase